MENYSYIGFMEIWKDINGYEGLYQVSNLGNVKSLDRVIWNGHAHHLHKGRVMKPKGNRYKDVILCKEGKGKKHYVHRLVALEFIPNTLNKAEVNHKNGIKEDNRLDNLEWSTSKENKKHAWDNGYYEVRDMSGINNPNYKHGNRCK
jgi:hypothetical protein